LALGYAVLAAVPLAVGGDEVGPFRAGGYLWAFGVLALPNLLVAGAALYGVAALTRSSLATWVTAIGLYVGYFGVSFLMGSPMMAGTEPAAGAALARAALLDPFGVMALHAQTRAWTPDVKSVEAVSLTGPLLLNRLLWLAVAARGKLCSNVVLLLAVAARGNFGATVELMLAVAARGKLGANVELMFAVALRGKLGANVELIFPVAAMLRG
ncbi:MAG: hypothetical protein DSY78_01755, partial [Chloroflexi bacterium]